MEIILKQNQKTFAIRVKTGASKTEILAYEQATGTYKIAIAAIPEVNKANLELIKFLKKHLKKPVKIIKGFKSKDKIIQILD